MRLTSHSVEQLANRIVQNAPGRAFMSKHRQFDRNGKHIPGRCRINHDSSLRKMMRAANRGAVPVERIRIIVDAQNSAAARPEAWLSGYQRQFKAMDAAYRNMLSPPLQPEPEPMSDVATETDKALFDEQNSATAIPQQSRTYPVKSNAARAAAKHGLTRADLFEVVGGWAFNIPAAKVEA